MTLDDYMIDNGFYSCYYDSDIIEDIHKSNTIYYTDRNTLEVYKLNIEITIHDNDYDNNFYLKVLSIEKY